MIVGLEFAMEVYGGREMVIDSTDLGHVVRAMNCNPSLETLEKLGVAKKKGFSTVFPYNKRMCLAVGIITGEKQLKLEEVVPIVVQLKKARKDEGCYEDFVECLKLYDKNEDGHMMAAELAHMFLALGYY